MFLVGAADVSWEDGDIVRSKAAFEVGDMEDCKEEYPLDTVCFSFSVSK